MQRGHCIRSRRGKIRRDPNQSISAIGATISQMYALGVFEICKANLLFLVVDHDIMGLDVSMHDTLAVTKVECLKGSEG